MGCTGLRVLYLSLLTLKSIAAPIAHANSGTDVEGESIVFPSRLDVTRAIHLAAGYLERNCGPDGRFEYRIDSATGREIGGYNVIRHAGAIYALAMLNRLQPDDQAREATIRGAAFLRRNYVGAGTHPDQLAVWSEPLLERAQLQYPVADLGATGLGLVSLAAVDEAAPRTVPLRELQGLGRFILFLQREDGSFISKYVANKGAVPNWQSLYYPGEAALGLVTLYQADHNRKWLTAAAKALSNLAQSRAGMDIVPADHWALIATAKLYRFSDQLEPGISRDQLIHHAVQICNAILREQLMSPPTPNLDGAFDSVGKTTPAATRLEGLLAALEFLPRSELTNQIEVAVSRGIAFLLKVQIISGPYSGGMPEAIPSGASHSSVIRIDYVQHAVCAWLRYLSFIRASGHSSAVAVGLN